MWRVLAVTAVVWLSAPALALGQCLYGGVEQAVTNVYFVNGMLSPREYVDESVEALEDGYGELTAAQGGSRYRFSVLHNPRSGGFLEEVADALSDRFDEEGYGDNTFVISSLLGVVVDQIAAGQSMRRIALMATLHLAKEVASDFLEDVVRRLVDHLAGRSGTGEATVAEHVECYTANLREGKRVIVVAHSEGNRFANDAIENAVEQVPGGNDSIGAVGVATPGRMPEELLGGYVTAKDDVVINALRRLFPGMRVPPGNVENDPGRPDTRDMLRHFFLSSYFDSGLRSREKMDALMRELAEGLVYPGSR